jgi:predicted O-methyltransferase YrrM
MTNPEVTENRIHRDETANPRKWPHGTNRVPAEFRGRRMQRPVDSTKHTALLGDWERELMYYLPRIGGPGDYANLGHAQGASAILMASAMIDLDIHGEVYSVDLFKPERVLRRALNNLQRYPQAAERIHLQTGATDEVVKLFQRYSFRGIFVDADHSYEAVKTDAQNWSKLVGMGGFICFHDTHQDFSHRAVEETVAADQKFIERLDLHIETIRVFERVK